MKYAINRVNLFLFSSKRIVPLYFFVFIPLILTKSTLSVALILALAAISFFFYWWVRWEVYKKRPKYPGRYILDVSTMAIGLVLLYGVEAYIYRGTDTINLLLYLVSFLFYGPTLQSTQSIINTKNK